MSIIGLDFGSHTGSIALWFEDKDTVDVIADDLGSRTIPCAVAYRGDEIITGSAATSQQHKNPTNTFIDIRSLLFNPECINVSVPNIDKEVTVQELASHWFRNIHNQIKQQVGKVVRECVISVPANLDEAVKARLVEAAQTGGVRLKCMIRDSSASLLAYGLDDPSLPPSKVAVVDIGWSSTEISIYDVSGGLFFPLASVVSTDICGKIFVDLLADHCAKDFQRKSKLPCTESSKSMMRLKRECEDAMKILSTGAEATIDIDSLYEGADYSSKITRARFEDLISIPLIQLKKVIADGLLKAAADAGQITNICLSGGLTAIPRIQATIKAVFPTANTLKGKFETSEVPCIGAALHGKYLAQLGLIDKAPTASPVAEYTTQPIFLSTPGGAPVCVFPAGTVVPASFSTQATVPGGKGFFQLLSGLTATPGVEVQKSLVSIFTSAVKAAVSAAPAANVEGVLGEIVFSLPAPAAAAVAGETAAEPTVTITLGMTKTDGLTATVTLTSDSSVLATVNIPSAKTSQ